MRISNQSLACALLAGLVLPACTGHQTRPERSAEAGAVPELGHSVEGLASWYGPGFAGRRTANGEIYDPRDLTAAHRTLPFNSRVLVRNLDNGRTCWVRINDRGPFIAGRVIDLSYSAAQALAVVGPGTARVALEVGAPAPAIDDGTLHVPTVVALPPAATEAPAIELPPATQGAELDPGLNGSWSVQVGAFAVTENAERLAQDLVRRGIDSRVEPDHGLARVRVGSWPSEQQAEEVAEALRRDGFETTVVFANPVLPGIAGAGQH